MNRRHSLAGEILGQPESTWKAGRLGWVKLGEIGGKFHFLCGCAMLLWIYVEISAAHGELPSPGCPAIFWSSMNTMACEYHCTQAAHYFRCLIRTALTNVAKGSVFLEVTRCQVSVIQKCTSLCGVWNGLDVCKPASMQILLMSPTTWRTRDRELCVALRFAPGNL